MSVTRRVAVVANPNARENRRWPHRLAELRERYGERALFLETKRVEDLGDAAAEVRAAGVEYLALHGGDGTNHVTLTAFAKAWGDEAFPRIVILRGGTMNTVSNSFGIRGKPSTILPWLLDALDRGETPREVARPLLRVLDGGETRYGFIFGNGVVSNFLRVYYEQGEVSPLVAAKVFVQVVFSVLVGGSLAKRLSARFEGSVRKGDATWLEGGFTSVMASSTEQIGLGFTPFRRAGERGDRIHVVAIPGGLSDIVRALPAVWRGAELPGTGFADDLAASFELGCSTRFDYTLDGDLYDCAGSLRLEAGPVVRVVIP